MLFCITGWTPVPGDWSHLTVQFPRRLLPLPEKTVQSVLSVPISGRRGMDGMFTRWLIDINARASEFTPADLPTLTSATLDLLASVIARCLEADEALSLEARQSALGPGSTRSSSSRSPIQP
ncbi:hypothetical protein ABZ760_21320 [Streptomyces sp. NPDC006658]|uniref:hypothetical protein n=1 Tax=Streptomyces sp. NPDC006658 TaxID=3156900 RepID=UPI0033F9A7B0